MRSHQLAEHLDAFAKLLRSLPDTEIGDALATFLSLSNSQKLDSAKSSPRPAPILPEDVELRLSQMTPSEIERYLDSEEEQFSTSQLLELARKIGVSTSKRQSRSALVNLITRHFEATQMNSIIRTARKDRDQAP